MAEENWAPTDYESRLRLTSRTNNGYYDQVLGLSEDIINLNFEKLFNPESKLAHWYDSVNGVGSIQMDLLPPKILIPSGKLGDNYQNVWFQVRLCGGWVKGADGTTLVESMKDWIITTDVKLDSIGVDDSPIDPKLPEKKRQAIQDKRDRFKAWIDNEFSLPGDYSIERIYAKLSSTYCSNIHPK
ncbi:hypothetical protein ABW19_dt0200441 [Dactylella cylindrospora]|nr:hypothetical protein ABW19_dt0200441 [Dactylella cylindrospora]